MKPIFRTLIVSVLLSSPLSSPAETLAVGTRLPELELSDQHDAEAEIGPDVRRIVFTRDMDGGDVVKAALAERGAATLEAAKAVYVAEISRMPTLVTRLFAVPSMRKREYRIVLDRDGKTTADFPYKEGHVTVLTIDDRVISNVELVDSADALRAILTAP
jgi:hypothetical protein